jgi:hypothetical protein
VLEKEPLTAGEARNIIELGRKKGRQQQTGPITRRARARRRSTTPETSALSSDESPESEESDFSTLIVCR